MELIPYKKNVSIVPMENKSVLAIALENVKVRDYPEEMKNTNTANMVIWLLNFLGVGSKEGNDKHHAVAFEFINSSLGNYTYQEIKLAFEKYVAGEYNQNGKPMLVTQQLNAVVIGRVMREYQILKNNELNAYRRKKEEMERKSNEPSEEDKKVMIYTGVINCFESFKTTGKIEPGYSYVYDLFYEKGLLPHHSKKYRERIKQQAISSIENELKAQSQVKSVKSELKLLKNGFKGVKAKCKQIVLSEYFSRIIEQDIKITEELKKCEL